LNLFQQCEIIFKTANHRVHN